MVPEVGIQPFGNRKKNEAGWFVFFVVMGVSCFVCLFCVFLFGLFGFLVLLGFVA